MAKKRFTDIEIWDKAWFMDLEPRLKCLVKYMFDKCDAAGVWNPNWRLASVHIKADVALEDLKQIPPEQYEILPGGKIFIPEFINFQYGKLSERSPAHIPVFAAIQKHNLTDRVFSRVDNRVGTTPMDKDIDIDIEKDKEEETEKEKDRPLEDFQLTDLEEPQNQITLPVGGFKPGKEHLEMKLPEIKVGAVQQLHHLAHHSDLSPPQVTQLWEVFKVKNFTGEKFYNSANDIYGHFIDWAKFQKVNGTTHLNDPRKNKGNFKNSSGKSSRTFFDQ